jgi:hypothetical protein
MLLILSDCLVPALKPLDPVVKLRPEGLCLLEHLVAEAIKVIPVGAEEWVVPKKVPQGYGNMALASIAQGILILCNFSFLLVFLEGSWYKFMQ